MIYTMASMRLVTFLPGLALVGRAATPAPAENPVATPAPARSPYSLKDTVPVESLLQNQITRGVTTRVLEDWANTPHSVTDFLSDKELSNVFERVGSPFRDFAAAVAAADIAAAKNQLTANIQNRVADAQKRLAKALAKQIEQALPTSKSGDRWWIDPIIGPRGQINFTRWLFLALQVTSADLEPALKSHGSPAAQLASISRAMFSWRQATAFSTWTT
jgi:hypothetical protein